MIYDRTLSQRHAYSRITGRMLLCSLSIQTWPVEIRSMMLSLSPLREQRYQRIRSPVENTRTSDLYWHDLVVDDMKLFHLHD
jgi:hypothetical protein